jgi:hypothetical protein
VAACLPTKSIVRPLHTLDEQKYSNIMIHLMHEHVGQKAWLDYLLLIIAEFHDDIYTEQGKVERKEKLAGTDRPAASMIDDSFSELMKWP